MAHDSTSCTLTRSETCAPQPSVQRRPARSVGLRWLGIPLLLAGIVCAFYGEVVFGGHTFLPLGLGYGGVMGAAGPWGYAGPALVDNYRWDRGASSWQVEPAARVVSAALASGQLPLWNPYQGLGAPLLANAQSGAFDLLRLPVVLSGAAWVWDAYYLARSLLTLGLTYVFVRRIGWSRPAALVAGCGYAFSGFMLILGNNHYVEVYALLPGLLLGTDLLLRRTRTLGVLVLAACVASSVLAGMPECTAVTFVFGGSYGAYLVGREAWRTRQWAPTLSLALALVVGWLAGLGLAAPLILPLAEYVSQGVQQHSSTNFGLGYQPLPALAYLAIPYLRGLPGEGLAGGQFLVVKDFVGGAVCVLAAIGAVCTWSGRLGRVAPFALVSAVFWGAKLFGVPVINEIGRLPGLNVSFVLDWARPLLSLSLALLAGGAVEAAARRTVGWRRIAAGVALFVAYLGVVLELNVDRLASLPVAGLRDTVGVAVAAACVAVVCLAVACRWRSPVPLGACAITILAELFILSPHGVYPVRYDPLTPAPFVDVLRQQQAEHSPFRIFALNGYLFPNLSGAFSLADLRAMDAIYPDRYMTYVRGLLAPVEDRYTGVNEPQTRLADDPWLDLAGVRYVVLPPGAPVPDGYEVVYDGEVRVVQNAHAYPRAFLTPAIRAVRTTARALQVMQQDTAFDPARTGLIEGSLPDGVSGEARAVEDPGTVAIERYTADDVAIRVRTPAQRLLVLTDVYAPGWQASVDGRPSTILPTDLAFRGVVVEAGEHEVRFQYAPFSFTQGCILAGAAVLLLAAFVALSGRPRAVMGRLVR